MVIRKWAHLCNERRTQTGLAAGNQNYSDLGLGPGRCRVVAAQWFFNIAVVRHPQPHPIPAWGRPLLGLLAGILGGCFLLLIGYINRDAKRRGISPTLWTILAIVVPNALGMIFILLRLPLRSVCPQCGYVVQPGFSFCPHCNTG